MSIYDFTVKAQDGSEVSLADYNGNGDLAARFEPTASMKEVRAKVEQML